MNIGLLMIREENDILERVLAMNYEIYDVLYVLDGTVPSDVSYDICEATGKLCGFWTDAELPRPPYPEGTVCGYRGFIHDQAVSDFGPDHWFLELHGDEVWTFLPEDVIEAWPGYDGFGFRLPCYFPRDEWKANVHPLDQLRWHLLPGWPEFRMYRGNPGVQWDPTQHFNTQPSGLSNIIWTPRVIKHYPYRSPEAQRARAAAHQQSGFDPSNYQHIVHDDEVVWTDAMIQRFMSEHHSEVACG